MLQAQGQAYAGVAAFTYRSLLNGLHQCLKAAHLQGTHPSLLQGWLGPAESLAQNNTSYDMGLMMQLQRIFFDNIEVGDLRHRSSDMLTLCRSMELQQTRHVATALLPHPSLAEAT